MVQNAFKIHSKRFEVAPQAHLKAIPRTSTGSRCIQNTFKTARGCSPNAHQSHLKNIKSFKSHSKYNHDHLRLHLKRASKLSQELQACSRPRRTRSGWPSLPVELPCARCLCWMQAARMHTDMHGRHGEGVAMLRRNDMRFGESVPAVWCKLRL